MKTLVLGGGWVGSRFCLVDPSSCNTTSRSSENLLRLRSLGLEAVEFDLSREDTWKNLPPKELVSATIITFALSRSQLSALQKLFAGHIAGDKPVLYLGTSSAFQAGGHECVITESTPLTGVSVIGKSLSDRIEGEDWILSKGATILHLSGIVGEEDGEENGGTRSVGSFIRKGYVQNGLKLVNLIHVKDICRIISILSGNAAIKGERILVSCGAFRWRDLAKGLSIDSLPEFPPPDETMKGSKIISTAKLCSLLPSDYEWTLPVSGVEPVSRGLPFSDFHEFFPDGAALERQWELTKRLFLGKWQATAMWYKRNGDHKRNGNHHAFMEKIGAKMLPPPSSLSPGTEYHIYSLDADTFVWHGKGLNFSPGGEKILEVSKKTFNRAGKSFCFSGVAGRCAVDFNSSRSGAEISFFYERSRSMIIVLYELETTSGKLLLETIGIFPFRCGYGHTFPLKPPQSEVRRSVETLLAGLNDKTCRMQWMSHTRGLDDTDGGEVQTMPTKSMLLFSDTSRLVQSFDDDLICSIPGEVEIGQSFELVFGCRHTEDLFQALTLHYSESGKIVREVFERWE